MQNIREMKSYKNRMALKEKEEGKVRKGRNRDGGKRVGKSGKEKSKVAKE